MKYFLDTLKRFNDDESGATAIEYGLIAALIAVVVIGAVTLLGQELETTFNSIKDALAVGNNYEGASEGG